MNQRKLGKKFKVSELGLGGWQLGGFASILGIPITYGNVNENSSKKIIQSALSFGINTFDTADSYSLGNSEKILGISLKKSRSIVKIFTKAGGVANYDKLNPWMIDLSYHHLVAALNRSLRRLQTTYVDLFQIHAPPNSENDFKNIEKTFRLIKKEGKALCCGVSIGRNYDVGIELIKRGLVDTLQIYFSLLDFRATEKLLPFAKKNNVGIIAAEPLSQGFLTGKYLSKHSFSSTDVRSRFPKKLTKLLIERSKKFSFLIKNNRKMNQIAIAYVLSHDAVSTCIPGVKNIRQLKSNLMYNNIKLTSKELELIKNVQSTFQ